jgi:hypothetical protein
LLGEFELEIVKIGELTNLGFRCMTFGIVELCDTVVRFNELSDYYSDVVELEIAS